MKVANPALQASALQARQLAEACYLDAQIPQQVLLLGAPQPPRSDSDETRKRLGRDSKLTRESFRQDSEETLGGSTLPSAVRDLREDLPGATEHIHGQRRQAAQLVRAVAVAAAAAEQDHLHLQAVRGPLSVARASVQTHKHAHRPSHTIAHSAPTLHTGAHREDPPAPAPLSICAPPALEAAPTPSPRKRRSAVFNRLEQGLSRSQLAHT